MPENSIREACEKSYPFIEDELAKMSLNNEKDLDELIGALSRHISENRLNNELLALARCLNNNSDLYKKGLFFQVRLDLFLDVITTEPLLGLPANTRKPIDLKEA